MNIDGVDISLDNLTQDLLELLVGERWPNGDEGAMRSLASAWSDAATQLDGIRQTASAAAQQVGQYCQGANADAFQAFWSANFDDGKTSWPSGVAPAALPFAVQFCKAMASALTAGANQIETTKDMIMGNIAILVATVTPQIAAGFFDFGATDATAVAEVLADRTVMQALLDGAKDLIVEMVEQAIEQGLMQAELAFVIQFKEMMEGHTSGIDWGQVGQAGLSGAEGGALGAGFGFGIGKAGGRIFGEDFGKSFAGRATAGVASGGLTNAGLDLLQNGKISASDFTKGSLAGVLGGMGGAGAAAGEKPAIDGEALPTELRTPDLTTPDLATPRTTDVPTVDASARTDLSGLMTPTTDHAAPTGIDNAAPSAGPTGSPVNADLSGGMTVDPSQASAATSTAAHLLGGGATENASIGGGATSGGGAGEPVGGSAVSAGTTVGGSGGAASGVGGVRATEASPSSARSDAGSTSTSGYTSVSELGAGSHAGSPGAADTRTSGSSDTASPGRQYADNGAGNPVGSGLPVAEGGSTVRDAGTVRAGSTDPNTGAGGGSSSGRFYGGRDSVLDRTGNADRSTSLNAENPVTSRDALNLADPRGADRAATAPSEPSAVNSPTREPVFDRAPNDSSAQPQEPQSAAVPSGSEHVADPSGSEHATNPLGSEHATEPTGGTVTADDPTSRESQPDNAAAAPSEPSAPAADGSRPDPARTEQPEQTAQPSDPTRWADGATQPETSPRPDTGAASNAGTTSDSGAKPDAGTRSDAGAKPDAVVASKPDVAQPDARTSKPDSAGNTDAPKADTSAKPDSAANTGAPKADTTPKPDSGTATPDASKPDSVRPDASGNGVDRGRPDVQGQQSPDGTGRADGSSAPAPDASQVSAVLVTNQPAGPVHDPSAQAASWAPPSQAGGLSDRLAQVNSRAEAGDRGISMFSDPEMAALAARVQADPNGAFDLNLHGDASGGISGLERLGPQDLLDLANANGHQPGQPFRLTSCEAGALDHGFAAELSRISGCKVIAADSLVWTDSAGHMFASKSHVDGFGESVPDIPPSGHWVEFSPDGTKVPIGENGFPPGQESGFGGWNSPVGDVRARAADLAPWNPPEPERTLKVPDPADPALRPLAPGDRFGDRSDLPPSARIDVVDTNGEPRGSFYTDGSGKITHAELPVPNTRHGEEQTPQNPDPAYQRHGVSEQNAIDGSNPDAATPPGDATVKYTWRDQSVVFKTDAAGEPQPPGVWTADASVPVKENFQLGPKQSVFGIKATLEPNAHYTAEQTPIGETSPRTTDFWTDGSGKIVAVDTWRGRDTPATAAKGGWNPNLGAYGQGKGEDGMRFQPGVTFRVDGKVGVTDEYGRVATMSLDGGAVVAEPLTPSVRNTSAQAESNSFGKDEHSSGAWDGGHKYPAAVGGASEPFNYFPQDRDSNQGNGADPANSWWTDEMDTVAAVKYQGAEVSGWDIIENHATGTPADPTTDPRTPARFNKTPETVVVRKTYRFPQPDGTLGPPRTTVRFTTNVRT